MKLRLRSIETNETSRIEVHHTCSLDHFKEVIFPTIHSSSSSSCLPSSIHLSLNRKDELLSTSPDDTLQSLGITPGDLIFFTLNPNSFSPQTLITQLDVIQEGPKSERPPNSPNSLTLDPPNSQKQQTLGSHSANSETETSSLDTTLTLGLNIKTGETSEYMEIDDDDEDDDVGKSFSVPGFLRKVFTEELSDDGGRHHKLLVIAVHAVLLESGFIAIDPVSKVAVKGFHLPEEWPSFAFMISLSYTLPEIVDFHETDAVVVKFQSGGKFFHVYGALANGKEVHWVALNEDQLVPFLNVVWANCGSVDTISSTTPREEVFRFWRIVKDKLALPLLIDLCERAGLNLPPCFMRLPTEIKIKIFESLPGDEIANVACVCSELRYLTSSDELWKKKFVEQFGDAANSEGGGGHWKEKFVKSWESRKRRKTNAGFMREAFGTRRRVFNPLLFQPAVIGGNHDILPPDEPLFLFGQDVDPLAPLAPLLQHFRANRELVLANRRLRNPLPHCNLGGGPNRL